MKGMLIQLAAATAAKGTNRLMIGGRRCKDVKEPKQIQGTSMTFQISVSYFVLLHVFIHLKQRYYRS